MSFDKEEYKKRRAAGLRGQGDKAKPAIEEVKGGYIRYGRAVNRKTSRQKSRSGFYTTKHNVVQQSAHNLEQRRLKVARKEAGEKARVAAKMNG